ncbi:MAG: glycosyltransferase family 2 protein [Eubacterium sp.]|nr:glycosyltransferase family 2 protein [Eubacterium sp.]
MEENFLSRAFNKALRVSGLYKMIYKVQKNFIIGKNVLKKEDVKEDYMLLEKIRPKRDNSCILDTERKTEEKYDLDIIIAAYNCEEYIEKCLLSCLNQKTDYSYRIIVSDDGSKDGTGDIIDEFAKKYYNIRSFHKENGGCSSARNAALELVKAKYVLFLDSDDWLAEGALEHMLKAAYKFDADILEGGMKCLDENRVYFTTEHKDAKIKKTELSGYPVSKLFRSSLFNNLRFNEDYLYEDSICSQILYYLTDRIYGLNKIVYYYRNNLNSISVVRKTKEALDHLWITILLYEERNKLGLPVDYDYRIYLINQSILGYKRLLAQDEDIRRAHFNVYCEFLEKEDIIKDDEVPADLKDLIWAIKTRDFGFFELIGKYKSV